MLAKKKKKKKQNQQRRSAEGDNIKVRTIALTFLGC